MGDGEPDPQKEKAPRLQGFPGCAGRYYTWTTDFTLPIEVRVA